MQEPYMQLSTDRIRPDRRLRAKDAVPLVDGHQQDVIRRCLRCHPSRNADRLQHRIGMRQVDNPGDPDVGRRQAGPMDGHRVADRHMQVGRRLLCNQDAIRAAEQHAELRRRIAEIGRRQAKHVALAGGLHGSAGMGVEAVYIGIADRLQQRNRRCLADGCGKLLDGRPGDQLHLPVNRHARDRTPGHGSGALRQECAKRGQQRHGERNARCSARQAALALLNQPKKPERDHTHPAVLPVPLSVPCCMCQIVSMRAATAGSWVAMTSAVAVPLRWASKASSKARPVG